MESRQFIKDQGRIEYPRTPDISGLMIRALAGQGLDSSTISILHFILSLLWVNYVFCDFGQSKTGVDEMIQYVPAIRVELMT